MEGGSSGVVKSAAESTIEHCDNNWRQRFESSEKVDARGASSNDAAIASWSLLNAGRVKVLPTGNWPAVWSKVK